MTNLETKLTSQTFVQAGGQEKYPNLEIAGVVHGKLNRGENSGADWNFKRLNQAMETQAKSMGATHIFDVKYLFRPDELHGEVLYAAFGTAYK